MDGGLADSGFTDAGLPDGGPSGPVTPFSRRLVAAPTRAIWGLDVAYDAMTDRYLVAFYNDNAIRGIYLDRNGDTLPGQSFFDITPTPREYGLDRVISSHEGLAFVLATVSQGSVYERQLIQIEAVPTRWKANNGVSPPIVLAATQRGDRGSIRWNPVTRRILAAWTDVSSQATPGASGAIATFMNQLDPMASSATPRALAADSEYCGKDRYGNDNFRGFASPEIAVAPNGSAFVVGAQDPTNEACGSLGGGIWYRAIDSSGAPTGTVGTLMRDSIQGLQLGPRVVFLPAQREYFAAWNNTTEGQGTWAQRFDTDGNKIGSPYSVLAANLTNADVGDDRLGQLAVAFDPLSEQMRMLARGQDPGNGIAPLFQWRTDSRGRVIGNAPVVLLPEVYVPSPELVSDGKGHFLAVYRKTWGELWITLANFETVP